MNVSDPSEMSVRNPEGPGFRFSVQVLNTMRAVAKPLWTIVPPDVANTQFVAFTVTSSPTAATAIS